MKTFTPNRCFYLAGSLLLVGSFTSFASDLVLQKVPPLTVEEAPAFPQNLARYNLGAQVEAAPLSHPIAHLQLGTNSEDRNAAEAALLCDDPTVGYELPAGNSTVLVSLPRIENVAQVSFLNSGAKGHVTIATASAKLAANSPQWHTVDREELSANVLKTNVGPGEAKYVRLTFNVTQPGRIAGFGVYSTPRVSDFTAPRSRKLPTQDKSDSFALISYNLTDVHATARALYVSSGSDVRQANSMIDDQTSTSYSFASGDASPTTVIDLGKSATLRRLSAVYSPRAGKVDFYVLKNLPRKAATASGAENLHIDDNTLANLKSVGSVSDDGNSGRAAVDFAATSGRYVMVRWTPAVAQDASFTVAEVAAFGGAGQPNTLLAANTETGAGEATEQYDGKTVIDGKTMIDTKDMPAEGPETAPEPPGEGPPPSLPQPPPFTFVPVLGPTSP